ncbi:MAG: cupin domain-containing protein [Firmicutes bacterium]|nr:cupin domain-containing protein [Bacillota bacterium]MBQ6426889.1 cupin domain-containing protein [Clostridia bacterium]
MKTTDFAKWKERETEYKCHGGEGPYLITNMIKDMDKQYVKFIHDDIIPPHSTFGNHFHRSETPVEEFYYCVSGQGSMYLDGEWRDFLPGDISVCRAGGEHGLVNTSETEDLRIIVIYASALEA